ncbi:MAG: FMN-binding protein [Candidatus Hydrogenedentes bacterium]|nr:FMN-binding protein [Candidatus Hydrogenedentota bacterium]
MNTVAETPLVPARRPASSFQMILTLSVVSTLSGLLLVFVYQATLPRIEANRRAALEQAVFEVLPGAETRATFVAGPDGFTPAEADAGNAGDVVYAGYDADGALVGVAVGAAGQGYQDVIKVLFGYSPERQCIIGFKVLESKETPGLGDRIGKDPEFLANFDGLDAKLDAAGTALAHNIVLVKGGDKSKGEIDGITGATISSTAVAAMLNRQCQEMIPYIMSHVDGLQKGGA